MDQPPFVYLPKCSKGGCGQPGVYKVAAPWSYGNINEFKNYGVCCDGHKDALFARAKAESQGLVPADGEVIGAVSVFQLVTGSRDTELSRVE